MDVYELLNSEFLEKTSELKKELEKLYIDIKEATVTTNLKLHELANTIDTEGWDSFNVFCEGEFDNFNEFLKEKNVKMVHVGRTSSFYLISNNTLSFYNSMINGFYNINDLDIFIGELSSYIDVPDVFEYERPDDYLYNIDMPDYRETLEDDIFSTDQFLKTELPELKKELDNVKSCYQYIEQFKAESIEFYKEFLAYA